MRRPPTAADRNADENKSQIRLFGIIIRMRTFFDQRTTGKSVSNVARPKRWHRLGGQLLAVMALLATGPVAGSSPQVYMDPQDFLGAAFASKQPPAPQVIWLTGALREQVSEVLGHAPSAVRVRYWDDGEQTVWVLEEIGKEEPITVGISVAAGKIEQLKVLIYRESRGWEVRHSFFVDQFMGVARRDGERGLDRHIDGISGATMSVAALTKLAEVALLLDARVRNS